MTTPDDLRVRTHPIRNFPRFALRALTGSTPRPPRPVPIHAYDANTWRRRVRRGLRCTWINHATVLVEIDGLRILTDPIFSRTPSPLPPFGPKRWHAPGLSLAQLPEIDAILLSHDHHDHLDRRTLRVLAHRGIPILAPPGLGATLSRWGINAYEEIDWWDSVAIEREGKLLTLTATPARHLSGRHLALSNPSLWCSWAIHSPEHSVWFAGDTGYHESMFTEIRERLGPFDMTLMPIGSYDDDWTDAHLAPEQAVQAHQDVGGGVMLPIHWATFFMGLHPWSEPIERARRAARDLEVDLLSPMPGEPVTFGLEFDETAWWR